MKSLLQLILVAVLTACEDLHHAAGGAALTADAAAQLQARQRLESFSAFLDTAQARIVGATQSGNDIVAHARTHATPAADVPVEGAIKWLRKTFGAIPAWAPMIDTYCAAFREHGVDGATLDAVTDSDLSELGVGSALQRAQLLHKWRMHRAAGPVGNENSGREGGGIDSPGAASTAAGRESLRRDEVALMHKLREARWDGARRAQRQLQVEMKAIKDATKEQLDGALLRARSEIAGLKQELLRAHGAVQWSNVTKDMIDADARRLHHMVFIQSASRASATTRTRQRDAAFAALQSVARVEPRVLQVLVDPVAYPGVAASVGLPHLEQRYQSREQARKQMWDSVVIDFDGHKLYRGRAGDRASAPTHRGVLALMDSFFQGSLQRHFRSQLPPVQGKEFAQPVGYDRALQGRNLGRIVVSQQWRDLVAESDDDVLLLFHSPDNELCQMVAPLYAHVAREFFDTAGLVVGAIDMSANDIDTAAHSLNITQLPFFAFFQGGPRAAGTRKQVLDPVLTDNHRIPITVAGARTWFTKKCGKCKVELVLSADAYLAATPTNIR